MESGRTDCERTSVASYGHHTARVVAEHRGQPPLPRLPCSPAGLTTPEELAEKHCSGRPFACSQLTGRLDRLVTGLVLPSTGDCLGMIRVIAL